MNNHIYLNCSLESLRLLKEDVNLEIAPEYDPISRMKLLQNEYGRIKTPQNYYHILVGTIQQDGCPWCNAPGVIINLSSLCSLDINRYCIQCLKCGATGPSLNINKEQWEDKTFKQYYMDFLWQRWRMRLPWCENFKNPYE